MVKFKGKNTKEVIERKRIKGRKKVLNELLLEKNMRLVKK